ncbi:hypothetical protein Peur_029004 [Populus x canadensis]
MSQRMVQPRKTFSFGHPSVEKVAERFISGNTPQILGAFQLIEAHRNARVCELNMQLSQKGESQSESELGENPIEELDMAQLEQLKASLQGQGLKHDVARQAEQILIQNLNPPQLMDTQNTSTKEVLPFDTWRSGFNTNMNVAPLNTNPTMAPYNTNMSVAPHGYTFGYENGNGFFWSAKNSVVNEIVSHNTIVVYLGFKSNYVFGLD